MQTIRIFGVEVADLDAGEAIALLQGRMNGREHAKLAFLNANGANIAWEDPNYHALFKDFLIFPDGIGIDLAAKALVGRAFRANLNGTDFIPDLLKRTQRPMTIGLVGGRPGIAARAADALRSIAPQHHFPLLHSGFITPEERTSLLARMAEHPLDLLLIAMGNPLQEKWIHAHINGQHATIAAGVGGLFDFFAGETRRAPLWIQQMRIEWLYRLWQEPRRLFMRYIIGNPLFLLRVLAAKSGLRVFP